MDRDEDSDDERQRCPVCGYALGFTPQSATFDVCPSCTTEFALRDAAGSEPLDGLLRSCWVDAGMPWLFSEFGVPPPEEWDPAAQLLTIDARPGAQVAYEQARERWELLLLERACSAQGSYASYSMHDRERRLLLHPASRPIAGVHMRMNSRPGTEQIGVECAAAGSIRQARARSDVDLIMTSDYGSVLLLAAPARLVMCDDAALDRLLVDLDAIDSHEFGKLHGDCDIWYRAFPDDAAFERDWPTMVPEDYHLEYQIERRSDDLHTYAMVGEHAARVLDGTLPRLPADAFPDPIRPYALAR